MFQVWLTSQVFKVEGILDINMIPILHFKKEEAEVQWGKVTSSGSCSQSSSD